MLPWKRMYEEGVCVVDVDFVVEKEEDDVVEVGGEEMKSRLLLEEPPIKSSDMRMQSFTEDAS